MSDRTPIELAMFAAWLGVTPEQIPPQYKGHTCPDTMARWRRVGEAARKQAIEEAAALAEQWRDENKASAAKARRSVSEGAQNMAEMLDGAAIECNAIAQAIRNLLQEDDNGKQ